MAIRNNNNFDTLNSVPRKIIKSVREFEATGRGLMVDKPDLQANEFNANASLSIIKRKEGDKSGKIYLFVDRIQTAWNISGSYAQAVASRTWVPRNLTMADLIIEGQCANQYEFDRLVVFIRDHMREVISSQDEFFEGEYASIQVPAFDFKLFPPGLGAIPAEAQTAWLNGTSEFRNQKNTYTHIPGRNAKRRVWMYILVTNIIAGHERFNFAPAFTLTCKVLWDVGDPDRDEDIKVEVLRELNYTQIYGELIMPDPIGPDVDYRLPISTYSGSSRGGTGGGGGKDFSAGTPPAQYAEAIAAQAPSLTNPAKGNPIKANISGCVPPDPGRMYFGQLMGDGEVFFRDGQYYIRVKWRDPPGGGDTRDVYVNNPNQPPPSGGSGGGGGGGPQ